MTEVRPRMHYPLLLKLLLVFVFFLPLRSVQIPVHMVGFEINPARIASALFTLALLINIGLDVRFARAFTRSGGYRNKYVTYLLFYFLISILYYYMLVVSGKTVLFAAGETFFLRNWQGRPFAQLLSVVTYGMIPFFLVQYYAQSDRMRKNIERALNGATLVLIWFALVQLISYAIFRSPIVGRFFFDASYIDLGYFEIFGIPFYRVNSLGAEPRDFGTFLLGAMPFYLYTRYGQMNKFVVINVLLMSLAFFLATSTSAFFALGIFLALIFADAIYRRRAHIRLKYFKYGFAVAFIIFVAFYSQFIGKISERTVFHYEGLAVQLKTSEIQPIVQEHGVDLAVLFYILDIHNVPLEHIMFGYGYSNFVTPIANILKQRFNQTLERTGVLNPNLYLAKLFLEGGIIGIVIYLMVFIYTLKLNSKLLRFFRAQKDLLGYNKALLLRFAFIGFFVAGAIQLSYYYFIPMGLIVGWLNGVKKESNGRRIA